MLLVQFSEYLESFSMIRPGIRCIWHKQFGLILFIESPCRMRARANSCTHTSTHLHAHNDSSLLHQKVGRWPAEGRRQRRRTIVRWNEYKYWFFYYKDRLLGVQLPHSWDWFHALPTITARTAASIWFGIWGSWIRVKKFYSNLLFTANFLHYAQIILLFLRSHQLGTLEHVFIWDSCTL